MIKETLTYTGYDGETVTEELYFNLTKFEATELAIELPNGLMDKFQNVKSETAAEDIAAITKGMSNKELMNFIKSLVIKGYGVKEGRLFVKDEPVTRGFVNSRAFHTLMMEFIENPEKAIEFMDKVFEADIQN